MNTNSNKKMEEILQQLETGVQTVFDSKNFKKYLKTMAHFHHYSANNTILIWLQKPEATYVAGFARWINEFDRTVRKGEKGIRIIVPILRKKKMEEWKDEQDIQEIVKGFRCSYVFDISQTEGKDLPAYMISSLEGNVQCFQKFKDTLIKVSPVPIFFERIKEGHGFYQPKEKRIVVSSDVSELQQTKTLVHEIAHSLMHNSETKKDINIEVEAESVAYCICSYYGLDTSEYSFPYIAGWSKDKTTKELRTSLERIRKTSTQLIESINDFYPRNKEESPAPTSLYLGQ